MPVISEVAPLVGWAQNIIAHLSSNKSSQKILRSNYYENLYLFINCLFLLALVASCTVVPIPDTGSGGSQSAQNGQFDPASYVNSIWESKVVPTVTQKAVDLPTLLTALRQDPTAASKKYGTNITGVYNFLVKGQGKVIAMDTSSPNGLITIDLGSPSPDGQTVKIKIGPLITGNAMRDSMGFIQFGQFENQIQFGSVSGALDDKVAQVVTKDLITAHLVGKTVSFYGAFSLDDPTTILISPVKMEIRG